MRNKVLCLLGTVICITAIITGCNHEELFSASANAAKKAIKEGGEGYEYAENVNMDNKLLNSVVAEVSQYVEIESVDNFLNENPVLISEDNIDLRIATVHGKDGKEYTLCFDGGLGTVYGLVDNETGENLIPQE